MGTSPTWGFKDAKMRRSRPSFFLVPYDTKQYKKRKNGDFFAGNMLNDYV